jgi:Zn finger protein HypA/HybF involved in hydrogenase expression
MCANLLAMEQRKSLVKKFAYWLGMTLEIVLLALAFRTFSAGTFLASAVYIILALIIALPLFRGRRVLGLSGPVFDRAVLPPEQTNPSLKPPEHTLRCNQCGAPISPLVYRGRGGRCENCGSPVGER